MDNKLDKYFKDKLHDREFGFDESYWAGAEKLLEGQKRRRRRGLLFWWFGGLVGIGILALGIWLFGGNDNPSSREKSSTELQKSSFEKSATNISTPSNSENNIGSEEQVGNQAKIEKQIQHGTNSETTQTRNASVGKSLKQNSLGSGSTNRSVVNSDNTIAEKETLQNGINQPGIKDNRYRYISENGVQELTGDLLVPGPENQIQQTIKTENSRHWNDLAFLDLRQVFVNGNFKRPLKPNEKPNEYHKPSPFTVGLMLGQLFQASARSDEKTIIGYQGGLVLQYKIKGKWFVGSGLQYKYRAGTFEVSKTSISKQYSFGVSATSKALRPTSLHYLSLPIAIGWNKNHHALEGGFNFDYLMGVRGEKGRTEVELGPGKPLPLKNFFGEQKGWIVEDGYKKLNTTAMLGYRYRVNRQLSFGLTANYTFGSILKKEYEPPIGNYLLKEADMFYLDLRAIYLLK